MEFLYRVLATAVAVWVSTLIVAGIELLQGTSTAARIGTLIGVALLFGIVNAVLKPIIKVAGCVLYLLTFGLVGLVVNGLLFMFVGWIAGKADLPFEVTGFWPGFFGAIVVAVVSFVLTLPLHVKKLVPKGRH
ncbi:phage holin family protein [Actinocrispum wychmicini]|uniref:Putative membrane protein n=1 Tax=Actinocrispum wychmicini TaxID=1213861 RepID=A0A4R2JG87_9PSEU|nr:phage holin family protein [Actinocrispum wychmicini]TCO57292.1 putative membrane protein [Actinocrispum wychmicini]